MEISFEKRASIWSIFALFPRSKGEDLMFLRFIPLLFENFHAFLPVAHKNIEIRRKQKT